MTQSQKKIITTVSVINATVNTLLALFKIFVGWIGNSQALIADGIHSFSDLLSDAIVYAAAIAGSKHADRDHPYGHRRIETLAAVIIAFLLIAVGVGLVYDTVLHLLSHHTNKHPTVWVPLVAVVSAIANEGLFRYSLKMGEKINSPLLRSNAWHNRSDAMVSLIVLIGVAGNYLGYSHFDAIAAFIIALLILKMGIKMIWEGTRELIDSAVDEETLKNIEQLIRQVPGVVAIHQLRTRSLGGSIFVDVHIIVDPQISVSEGHHISDQVHMGLLNEMTHVTDVTVHIDPEDDEKRMRCLGLPNRESLAAILEPVWKSLPGFTDIQRLVIHYLNGQVYLEIYLPLSYCDSSINLRTLYLTAANKLLPELAEVTFYFIANKNTEN